MRYFDINLYTIKPEIPFLTHVILTQMHACFSELPLAVDFPSYSEGTENYTDRLNTKISYANSGNKIRLFTADSSLTRDTVIDVLDLTRLIGSGMIEVTEIKDAPQTSSVVTYRRDRSLDHIKKNRKKLKELRLRLNREFKAMGWENNETRLEHQEELDLRAAIEKQKAQWLKTAHTKISIAKNSLSSGNQFSMLLIRESFEDIQCSTDLTGLSSYGVSTVERGLIYLPKF